MPTEHKDIRLVIFDFDGVMTDNRVLVHEDGTEAVFCNRSDGLGVGMLRATGMPIVVLSMEENPVVKRRCDKLKIECFQGHKDKLPALKQIMASHKATAAQTCYVGNDVNDLPCLEVVGLAVAVADCHEAIRPRVHIVTRHNGGMGAVREVCDWFLAGRASP